MPSRFLESHTRARTTPFQECKLRINRTLSTLDTYITSPSANATPRFPDEEEVRRGEDVSSDELARHAKQRYRHLRPPLLPLLTS